MASTYTTNLGIEKIGTGEQSGTWGDTTNTNFDILDEAVNGIISITLSSAGSSGSPNSLPITDGASSNGRNKFIEFVDGGDLGGTAYVQLTPNDAEKIVHIRNSLSSSRSIIVFQGTYNSSNDFEIVNGADVLLKFNGGGSGATVTDVNVDLTVTGATIATADINGGAIDGTVIGGSTAAAGTFTTFTSNGIDDNADAVAITIDSSENVGIGATTVNRKLELAGNNNGGAKANYIRITDTDTSATLNNQQGGIEFYTSDTGNEAVTSSIEAIYAGSGAGTSLSFSTAPSGSTGASERLRIDHNGNVGIGGIASPQAPFHIYEAEASVGKTDPIARFERFTSGDNAYLDITVDNSNNLIGFQSTGTSDGGFTFGGASTERMRIDSSGDVNIGTTGAASGSHKLVVESASTTGTVNSHIALIGDSATNGQGPQILFSEAGDGQAYAGGTIGFTRTGANSQGALLFSTRGSSGDATTTATERMRINSSGNVGIGGTGNAKLEVFGPLASPSLGTYANSAAIISTTAGGYGMSFSVDGTGTGYIQAQNFTSSAAYNLSLNPVGGNVGIGTTSPNTYTNFTTLTINGTNGGVLDLEKNGTLTGELYVQSGAEDIVLAAAQSTGSLVFMAGGLTERARIDTSGNLLVGTTTNPASSGSGSGFIDTSFGRNQLRFAHTDTTGASRSFVVFYGGTAGNTVGSITASNTTTTYNTTSDQRLKENIVDAPAGNIDAIRVRSFDWKADGAHQTYGMVAQELVDVAPEAVTQGETEDDMWAVDYSKLVPMMIKEIQDLKAEVAALKGA